MIWVAVVLGVILLIGMFPKQMLGILGVLVLLIATVFLYFQGQADERQREKDSVQVSVKYDEETCNEEFPLFVAVRNTGYNPVNKVSWNLAAYRPGYSSNVISYGTDFSWDTPYYTDKILNTGEEIRLCYKVPTIDGKFDPGALNYEITNKTVVFQK